MFGEEGETIAQKSIDVLLDWKDIWNNIRVALLRLKPKEVTIEQDGIPVAVTTNIFEEDTKTKPLVTNEGLNIIYSELIALVNKNTFLGKLRRDEAMKMYVQIIDRLIKVLVSNYDTILYSDEYECIEYVDEKGKKIVVKRKKINPANINLVLHIISENIFMALNRAIDGHTSETIKTIQKIHETVVERSMENEEKKKKRFGIFG